ncbi:MAG: DNA repair protein RecO [Phycisphaerales bacterium]
MPTITDEAICIRQWDWSETSQTVSLFARATGVIRGVAKGSKRPRSPYSGGLEVLTRGELTAALKRPGALSIVTSWDLRDPYPPIRRDLVLLHTALLVVDLIHHALREEDPHPALYDDACATLESLAGDHAEPARDLLAFQWSLARETGHRPELDRRADTGAALERGETYCFSPEYGGLLPDPPDARVPGHIWRVREETVRALRASRDARDDATGGAALIRANQLLATFLGDRLGFELPTLAPWVAAMARRGMGDNDPPE